MRSKIPIVIGVIALLVLGTLGYFQYLSPASRMPDWVSIEEGPVAHGVDKFYRSVYVKGNLTTAGDLTVVGTSNLLSGCNISGVYTLTNLTVTNTTTLGDAVTDTISMNGHVDTDITLANRETIGNSTDGQVDITTDDFVVGTSHDFTGSPSTIAGGDTNTMWSRFSFIGGGSGNVITGTDITDDARYSVLVGGDTNEINSTGNDLVLVGGYSNLINGAIDYSFLGGGYSNEISGTSNSGVLVGGGENSVGGSWASILGGYSNEASGDYSLALGRRAKSTNDGTFVWGDSTDADITDIGANSFNVRATGGMYVDGPAYLETGYAAKTDAYTALITETGKTFSNQGATGYVTITLPAASPGLNYCVYVFAVYTMTVSPDSGDQIHHLTDAATNRIQNAGTVGDNVCLRAADNTYWLPVPAEHGTWNDIN